MNEKSSWQIIETRDGSHSLISKKYNAEYHSIYGAITEGQHVYIKYGLAEYLAKSNKKKISILEVGLGSGLNALLAADYASEHSIALHYTALEPNPLPAELAAEINYPDFLAEGAGDIFGKIHASTWDEEVTINPNFTLFKTGQKVQQWSGQYDLIFYDAFGPGVQEEMWEMECCHALSGLLANGGQMLTYCAQGQFKRNLKQEGLDVESLPGPPGKREMTRASKGE